MTLPRQKVQGPMHSDSTHFDVALNHISSMGGSLNGFNLYHYIIFILLLIQLKSHYFTIRIMTSLVKNYTKKAFTSVS
jgi:hypothetical protein